MSIVITLLQRDAVLRSIGATNSKLYEVLSDYMCGEVYIKSKIEKLDITYKLEVIESYISEVSDAAHERPSIHKALTGIHEMCDNLHNELDEMLKKIKAHKQKYFYYLRSFDVSSDLANIETHVHNLDHRFKMFLGLMTTQQQQQQSQQQQQQSQQQQSQQF
jgi:hypothetical protein